MTYTGSGVTTTTNYIQSNIASNNLAPTDVVVYKNNVGTAFSSGTVITLNAGMFTSTNNVSDPAPASGTFTTFITDGSGVRVSGNGTPGAAAAAPEPGTLSLVGMGLVSGAGMLGSVKRRKAKQAA